MADAPRTSADSSLVSVVVGAGAVGLAAAVVLAEFGDVVVIERSPRSNEPTTRWGVSARTVALHGASRALLESFGRWTALDAHPIRAMHVWEVDGTAAIRFSDPGGLAWVVDSVVLERELEAQAHAAGVRIVRPVVLDAIEPGDGRAGWSVSYTLGDARNREAVEADLVVGADGAASTVASLFGVTRQRVGRAQWAIVTIAKSVGPHGDVAHQRFNRDGPVATLPLGDPHLSSVIWSADQHRHEALNGLDDAAFSTALSQAMESAMTISDIDRRFAFPLNPAYVKTTTAADHVVLVGDAARTLHPLAGQGLNLGLEDVIGLREVIQKRRTPSAWRRYADDRRARSRFMLTFLSGLLETYRGQGPFTRLIRNIGVRAIESSPRAKAQLVREAMGLGPLAKVGLP